MTSNTIGTPIRRRLSTCLEASRLLELFRTDQRMEEVTCQQCDAPHDDEIKNIHDRLQEDVITRQTVGPRGIKTLFRKPAVSVKSSSKFEGREGAAYRPGRASTKQQKGRKGCAVGRKSAPPWNRWRQTSEQNGNAERSTSRRKGDAARSRRCGLPP